VYPVAPATDVHESETVVPDVETVRVGAVRAPGRVVVVVLDVEVVVEVVEIVVVAEVVEALVVEVVDVGASVVVARVVVVVVVLLHWLHLEAPPVPQPMGQHGQPDGGHIVR